MRHLGLFDVHCPRNIPFEPVLKFIQMYRPDEVIIGGDFLNLEFASHWNEKIFKHIGLSAVRENLEKEIEAGKALIGMIRQASKTGAAIKYLPGNHEAWLYWCAIIYGWPDPKINHKKITFKSDLARMMDYGLKNILERELDTARFRVDVLPYNEPYVSGKITYAHGDQFGIGGSLRKYPDRNLVFGHHHTHDVKTLHNSGENRRGIEHVAVPCLTPLAPGYLKCKSSRWLNGFWVADILGNGLFDGRVVKVLNGKIIGPNL